jgi:peptide/nickel transport system substrate-binding protein
VRQALAMGIDRQRIVDNFYPTGSEVATHFTPCNVPFGCEGDDWYDFNPTEAKRLLAEAGFPNGFDTTINYRDVVRGYLPDPNVVSQEIQTQLRDNLGINATIEVMESAAFLDSSSKGELTGLYLLGWGADFPDPVNFLDYHFNNPNNVQFGTIDPSITEPQQTAAQTLDETARKAAYEEANNAIKAFVPMVPIAHGASAAAYLADVTDAQASPLTSEWFATMDPGGRDTFRWMQNAEPISLYCGDETDGETLRICEQINEPLYQYAINGVDPEPALATGCEANDDGTVWTCALREGVTFHNGAAFDANDVVVSFALQWDAEHPLHIGRQGLFEYWGGLWGANLNPPPAEPAS